jgi:protein O-mannosyl-transferase
MGNFDNSGHSPGKLGKGKNMKRKGLSQKPQKQPATITLEETLTPDLLPFSMRIKYLILALVGLVFYANTFYNQTALDDEPVITKNAYVKEGFSGIPKIMKKDAYASFYEQLGVKDQLEGGRYRPLSIVTFAIEWELFGDNPFIRHMVNVLLYVFSVLLLFYFLSQHLFRDLPRGNDLAFFISLIFLIHPIHTEVVANTKSRDEIMSLLFMVGTFIFVFRNFEQPGIKNVAAGIVLFLCTLLSKEWGVTLAVLIPASLYIFRKADLPKALLHTLPYFFVLAFFLLIRLSIVKGFGKEDPELLNNPYVLANPAEKLATKIFVLFKYLSLQIFPYPLSSDYSYNAIPYKSFSHPGVIFSILFHVGLVVISIPLFFKRKPIAFAILFYLGHLFLVSNLFFNIGATMGERLVYHSSLGFVMAVGLGFFYLLEKVKEKSRKGVFFAALSVPTLICMPLVIDRNAYWKNDITLFTEDVKTVPNSAWMNGNAGRSYIVLADSTKDSLEKTAYLEQAIHHLHKAVALHPRFVNALFYLGSAHYRLNRIDSSEYFWNRAREFFPRHPDFKNQYDPLLSNHYVKKAENLVKAGDLKAALPHLEKALAYYPDDAEMWYNLGGLNFTLGRLPEARDAWTKCLKIKPDHAQARLGLSQFGPLPDEFK